MQTTLAQAVATSNMIVLIGIGILLLLNTMQPGTVQKMTTNIVGQVALVLATLLFSGGVFAIRRMTRIE